MACRVRYVYDIIVCYVYISAWGLIVAQFNRMGNSYEPQGVKRAITELHAFFMSVLLQKGKKRKLTHYTPMAKKATKKEDNKLNLESILFNCRDYLRSNATLNDKRDLLLTLVFLRFIGEKFEEAQQVMRTECIKNGIEDEAIIEAFLNSPNRYQNVVYVPEVARWNNIINIAIR